MVQPLTATFAADFSNFKDAVSRAEDSLKSFGLGANNVEKSLISMGNSLSGSKVVQQATLAAEAVELIGGTAKLTDKELERLGRTATEAALKLERMGKDVPPQIKALATAAKEAETNTGAIGRVAQLVGPQILAAFSVGAITAWVSSTIEAGSKIEDLSRKLDVSHEAIQRWGYAADLSGASIDDVSQAIGFMNKTLGGGSNSTIEALKQAGLQFDAIRAMSPEDAFDAITEAIKNIPDPMTQAKVALELFGKGASALLPAIRDGFREVGAEASVMSEATIEALDKAGDAWTKLKNVVVIASGAMIAAGSRALDDPLGNRDIHKAIDEETAALSASIGRLVDTAEKAYAGRFTPAVKDADQAYAAYGATVKESEPKILAAAAAQEEHTKKIKALADTLTGQAIVQKANDLAEAIKLSGGAAKLTAAQTDLFFKAADALVKGPLGASALPANVRKFWEENGRLALGIDQQVNPSLDRFYEHLYGIDQKLPQLKGNIATFLKDTSVNIKAAWEADEAAGKKAATETEKAHKESLKAIEDRHNQFVGTVTGYSVALIDSLKGGWDSFKQAGLGVLQDILLYMEKTFVTKMLAQFGLMQVGGTSAFNAIGAASATNAASASSTWLSFFTNMSIWAGSTYLVFAGLIKLISSPSLGLPPPTPGPPGGGPGGDFEENLNFAQSLFDAANSTNREEEWARFYDYMKYHGDLWGQGNGFAGGTHGQYLDFGVGTPVMLHGKERVMTENEGWRQGTGVTIVVQTLDSADFTGFLRRGGAREIADALGPHLVRVLA